jgi:hypothetical protein
VRRRKKSGEVFWARLSLSLMRDEEGLPIGLVGYLIDVTDRLEVEEKLRLVSIIDAFPKAEKMAKRLGSKFWQEHHELWARSRLTQVAYRARQGLHLGVAIAGKMRVITSRPSQQPTSA